MIYVCNVYREEMATITGKGTSAEEAKQDCLQKLSLELEVEVKVVGGTIPLEVAERAPSHLPPGCQLVVFERTHSGSWGTPYNWRFFALPFGRYTIDQRRFKVTGRCPIVIDTIDNTDTNSDLVYPLPEGSVEYVDGQWLPSFGVEYDY